MSAENTDSPKCCSCSLAMANFLLRLWIGLRLFMAGVAKFRAGNGFGHPHFSFSSANLLSLENKDVGAVSLSWTNYLPNTERIAKLMADNSMLPEFMCNAYAKSIGFVLLFVGAWVAVGIFQELGLFVAGLTVLSLGFGLASLPDDTEVVYIGVHILVVAAALATSKKNRRALANACCPKQSA